jgi:hypothetical protein
LAHGSIKFSGCGLRAALDEKDDQDIAADQYEPHEHGDRVAGVPGAAPRSEQEEVGGKRGDSEEHRANEIEGGERPAEHASSITSKDLAITASINRDADQEDRDVAQHAHQRGAATS